MNRNTTKLFLWGFCKELNPALEILSKNYDCFVVSDWKKSDINIIDCFKLNFSLNKENALKPDLKKFEVFKELFSRHWYPKTPDNHFYKDTYNKYYSLFTEIIKEQEITHCLFSNIPHEGPDYILYNICKESKIPTLIFYQSLFPNRLFLSDNLDIFNPSLVRTISPLIYEVSNDTKKYIKNSIGKWFYMNNSICRKSDITLKRILLNSKRYIRKSFILNIMLFKNIIRFFYEYKKFVSHDLPKEKFVYFPLHLQPELTTSILGGEYVDQIKAIEYLKSTIPKDYKIVVKENPKQSPFKRPSGFYEKLLNGTKQVVVISNEFDSLELIRKSEFVSTVTGTAGWEAIFLDKKVLTFGTTWYLNFPGVYTYNQIDELIKSLNSVDINQSELEAQAIDFTTKNTLPGITDSNYIKICNDFDANKNAEQIVGYINKFIVTEVHDQAN